MIAKILEIRDAGTFIPMLAVQLDPFEDGPDGSQLLNERNRHLLARAGFGMNPDDQAEYILLIQINGGAGLAVSDPHSWPGSARTYPIAHQFIIENWHTIFSGDIIDVEFILGETSEKKAPDALGI